MAPAGYLQLPGSRNFHRRSRPEPATRPLKAFKVATGRSQLACRSTRRLHELQGPHAGVEAHAAGPTHFKKFSSIRSEGSFNKFSSI